MRKLDLTIWLRLYVVEIRCARRERLVVCFGKGRSARVVLNKKDVWRM
jgi:hypothetical protein